MESEQYQFQEAVKKHKDKISDVEADEEDGNGYWVYLKPTYQAKDGSAVVFGINAAALLQELDKVKKYERPYP